MEKVRKACWNQPRREVRKFYDLRIRIGYGVLAGEQKKKYDVVLKKNNLYRVLISPLEYGELIK